MTPELLKAAEAAVAKLDAVHADYRYMSVWAIAQDRCGPYDGPTYTEEIDALRAAVEAAKRAAASPVSELTELREWVSARLRPARTDRIEVRHDPELRTAVIDLLMEIARCYSDTAGALDEAVQRVKKELAR